jgi:hypothetical protein
LITLPTASPPFLEFGQLAVFLLQQERDVQPFPDGGRRAVLLRFKLRSGAFITFRKWFSSEGKKNCRLETSRLRRLAVGQIMC